MPDEMSIPPTAAPPTLAEQMTARLASLREGLASLDQKIAKLQADRIATAAAVQETEYWQAQEGAHLMALSCLAAGVAG